MNWRVGIVLLLMLAGCGGEQHQELRQWMDQQGESAKGKIEQLPQIKPFESFSYNAFDLPDPFRPRKIEPSKGSGGKLTPDFNRRKEALESFPLESIKMVGTLQRDKTIFALVRTSDRAIYQVRTGNYMGQNFGIITTINDAEIRLKELVQDSAGDWSERTSSLLLDESELKQERRK